MSSNNALQQITNFTNNKAARSPQLNNKLSRLNLGHESGQQNLENYHQYSNMQQMKKQGQLADKDDNCEKKVEQKVFEQDQSQQDMLLQNQQDIKQQPQSSALSLPSNIIELSKYQFDFVDCMPGSVQEKPFSIKLNCDLQTPASIFVYVHCEDQILNSLPEYVFGVRRPNSFQYYDQFKFKVSKKSQLSFILGTKVPNLVNYAKNQVYTCQCRLFVWIDGFSSNPLQATLNLSIRTPRIVCPKQLIMENNIRTIKISAIKNKAKKECKIPFRVSQSFTDGRTLSLQIEVIGIDSINNHLMPPHKSNRIQDVEVRPKILNISGNGQFFLNFGLNFTEEIKNTLGFQVNQQEQKGQHKKVSYCKVRKVLIIKIKNTSCIYHFPIQACFYNNVSGKVTSDAE